MDRTKLKSVLTSISAAVSLVTCLFVAFVLFETQVLLGEDTTALSIAERRMKLMQDRCAKIEFKSNRESYPFPDRLESEALFRYDDIPRGYVDGAVWRLGGNGRPKAIITTELHKDFFGAGPKIIYEFLSLTNDLFTARSIDIPGWSPDESAAELKPIDEAPIPADTKSLRLVQMKRLAERFTAQQVVEGEKIQLRRLPTPIDRYAATDDPKADGVIIVFASGRMPGMILLIETDGKSWQYGVGRLSRPSLLVLNLDGTEVWRRRPSPRSWSAPFTSTNASASVP